ncbi:MAG: CtsR family transcriptional regulator [Bacillota bacterium]
MSTLTDQIERYIKKLLDKNESGVLELKRADLAEIFMCVPSQINYVLETRFTNDQGYHIESRRGGGGYLRIIRLSIDPDRGLSEAINTIVGRPVSQQAGQGLVDRLVEEEFLTKREAMLVKAVLDASVLKNYFKEPDLLRGHLLQSVLVSILRQDFEKGDD